MIRSGLDGELKERLRTILLSTGADPHVSPTLAGFGLERFAPITYEHYAPEEQALRECERVECPAALSPDSRASVDWCFTAEDARIELRQPVLTRRRMPEDASNPLLT